MEQNVTQYVDSIFANFHSFTQQDGLIGKPVVQGNQMFLPLFSVTVGYSGGDTQSKGTQDEFAMDDKKADSKGGELKIDARLSADSVIVIPNISNNVGGQDNNQQLNQQTNQFQDQQQPYQLSPQQPYQLSQQPHHQVQQHHQQHQQNQQQLQQPQYQSQQQPQHQSNQQNQHQPNQQVQQHQRNQ